MGKKIASAIGYSVEDAAPRLLASGRGKTAERIITLAQEAGVTVIEDPALAVLLEAEVQAGDIIPVWCWEATAKILAFVFAQKEKR
jgi:flagellar biosynthesis protein